MFSILPFEVPYFAKHNYPIHYVGNPCVDAVADFKAGYRETYKEFCDRHGLDFHRPIVAILAGSRKQEIRDNLPIMLAVTKEYTKSAMRSRRTLDEYPDFQWVVAGAPGIDEEMYRGLGCQDVKVVFAETYPLLTHSYAAMVTSGTATLETALFQVPQVVCYYMKFGKVVSWLRKLVLKVEHISLVNLVADFPLVRELVADEMNELELRKALDRLLLYDSCHRDMIRDYIDMVLRPLGAPGASEHAAAKMVALLKSR